MAGRAPHPPAWQPAFRVIYRLRQFWEALRARRDPAALAAAREVLSPNLWALFAQMPPGEQAHALRVFRRLQESGCSDPEVLTAALLHDVGKALQHPRLWERVAAVLGQACCPRLAARWGQGEPRGWRRPFVIAAQHPAWGARLAESAGASPRTVALIRAHQETARTGDDPALARLQWADAQE